VDFGRFGVFRGRDTIVQFLSKPRGAAGLVIPCDAQPRDRRADPVSGYGPVLLRGDRPFTPNEGGPSDRQLHRCSGENRGALALHLPPGHLRRLLHAPRRKPRRNFVDLRADGSRPCRFIVGPHKLRRERFPGGSLVAALCRVVAGAAGLDYTRSGACHTEVKVILMGAEKSHMVWNARGADTPGAFGWLT
jgi:hypothetical protein